MPSPETFPSASPPFPVATADCGEKSSGDFRFWSCICHLAILIGLPFLLPLWVYKKNKNPLITAHAKETLNFQLTYTLIVLLATALFLGYILLFTPKQPTAFDTFAAFVPASTKASYYKLLCFFQEIYSPLFDFDPQKVTRFFCAMSVIFSPAKIITLISLIPSFLGTIQAFRGKFFRYPLTIRFIK